jgi:hypothetical protein
MRGTALSNLVNVYDGSAINGFPPNQRILADMDGMYIRIET